MGSVSTLARPTFKGVEVTPSAVKAAGIDAAVTNGCVFLTFPDETMLKAFVSGLMEKGVLHNVNGLEVRFFVRNNH